MSLVKNPEHKSRIYDIDASLARALDLLGERWTLLIIRQLLAGEQRYGELYQSLYGISSNLLSMRLRKLIETGVIERTRSNGSGRCYQLTYQGQALAPVIWLLEAWTQDFLEATSSEQQPRHRICGHRLSPRWHCRHCNCDVPEEEWERPPSLSAWEW